MSPKRAKDLARIALKILRTTAKWSTEVPAKFRRQLFGLLTHLASQAGVTNPTDLGTTSEELTKLIKDPPPDRSAP